MSDYVTKEELDSAVNSLQSQITNALLPVFDSAGTPVESSFYNGNFTVLEQLNALKKIVNQLNKTISTMSAQTAGDGIIISDNVISANVDGKSIEISDNTISITGTGTATSGQVLASDGSSGVKWSTPADTTYTASDPITITTDNNIELNKNYLQFDTNSNGSLILAGSESATAGQILSATSDGGVEWVTPASGTVYSAGSGINISESGVISNILYIHNIYVNFDRGIGNLYFTFINHSSDAMTSEAEFKAFLQTAQHLPCTGRYDVYPVVYAYYKTTSNQYYARYITSSQNTDIEITFFNMYDIVLTPDDYD